MPPTLLGTSPLARELGVSRQMVNQYEREGKITRQPGGKFDLDSVRQQLAKNLGPKIGGVPRRGEKASTPPDAPKPGTIANGEADTDAAPPGSKADYEKKLLAERVERIKLDNGVRKAQLVDAAEAAAAWGQAIVAARNKALMLPAELAPKLAAVADVAACEEILKAGIYEMLSDLAEQQPNAR